MEHVRSRRVGFEGTCVYCGAADGTPGDCAMRTEAAARFVPPVPVAPLRFHTTIPGVAVIHSSDGGPVRGMRDDERVMYDVLRDRWRGAPNTGTGGSAVRPSKERKNLRNPKRPDGASRKLAPNSAWTNVGRARSGRVKSEEEIQIDQHWEEKTYGVREDPRYGQASGSGDIDNQQ